jgi:hypothetical protein
MRLLENNGREGFVTQVIKIRVGNKVKGRSQTREVAVSLLLRIAKCVQSLFMYI